MEQLKMENKSVTDMIGIISLGGIIVVLLGWKLINMFL